MTHAPRSLAVAVASLLIAAVPAALASQATPDRRAMFRLRDSMSATLDTSGLLALETHVIDSAKAHRDDPVLHLRLGFIGLRLAEITGGASHFRDAEGEFQWATELQPRWPLPWYGLSTAELAEADVFPAALRGLFSALGRDLFTQPALDMAKSAVVDSNFVEGLVELGNDALRRGIGSHLTTALLAFRDVAKAPAGRNVAVLLLHGRIEREIGDADTAIAAFRDIVRHDPSNAVAHLELARTLMAAGRLEGVAPWYAGLALADGATLAMYRFDLSLVMSDSALRAFDAVPASQRVAVARRFWDSRDGDALSGGAERLKEHYRRIDFAHRNYAMVSRGNRYDSLHTFTPTASRFDDRGRIYVRHGAPDDRTSLTLIGLPPNETWAYHRASGDLLFNFAQPDSAQGYRLYESLLDIVGLGTAARVTGQGDVAARLADGKTIATYGAGWTAQAAEELLYSRARISPVYRAMLSQGPQTVLAGQKAERAAGQRSLAIGLQTDSWKFGYELPLQASVDVLAVGTDAAGTQLQVAFAIDGASLYAPPTTGLVVYPIRTRVAVRNAAGDVVASIDTLRNFVASGPIAYDSHLLGRLPMSVPPGTYTVRVAVETESRGMVTAARTVRVAPLAAHTIELSDLAIGSRSVPLPWQVGGSDTAWVNPLHRFRSHEPLQLFFEVGGVAVGSTFHGQLLVLRVGHKDAQMQVAFDAVAAATPNPVHREIDISRLGTGDYVLEMTVSSAAGQRVTRRREFTVTK